ncbi:maltase 2-like isoform X2 [Daktulosphaira vitifoliae]|uniref:maltase 2-like isoform X2 n=1 Tax=Daktulosphaira vitifoliae TaxID=58002 RepID=UPI0021A9BC31|nr:maltase 2-like isoform X2 [Daktulosphaira vitifoliae]
MIYFKLIIVLFYCFCTTSRSVYLLSSIDNIEWWQNSVIYEIFLMSFKDSNSDGIGDLNGVTQKIEYLSNLGIDAIWLTPFYQSPLESSGYDITDYESILPIFGNINDFKNLVKSAHEKDIKVLIDFVPNHTSNKHVWFKKSVKKIEPYTNYYIWRNAKNHEDVIRNISTPIVPNNWLRMYPNGDDVSAWIWNDERRQYYYTQFSINLPDLNYRQSSVHKQMNNILKYWLELSIDGIRIDALKHVYEKYTTENESLINPNGPYSYDNLNHTFTTDQIEVYDLIKEWRNLLDTYSSKDGNKRIIMTESYSPYNVLSMYFKNGAQIPTNFNLIKKDRSNLAFELYQSLQDWFTKMPPNSFNSVLQNHDVPRISSQYGSQYLDNLNVLQLFLPGPCIMYYGGEIGMDDFDNLSNDIQRTPMQWDNNSYAGFTDGNKKPWIPVNPNYIYKNVMIESNVQKSHLNFFKTVSMLRHLSAFKNGGCVVYNFFNTIIVIHSFQIKQVNLSCQIKNLSEKLSVVVGSKDSGFEVGDQINSSMNFTMKSFSAVILTDS